MQFKLTLPLLLLLSFSACSPAITKSITQYANPLPDNTLVSVFGPTETVPENATKVGFVKLTDTGFTTKCKFDYVVEQAMVEAIGMGGNILKITKHRKPDFWSTCHRIQATVFYSDQDISSAITEVEADNEELESSPVLDSEYPENNWKQSMSQLDNFQKFRLAINGGFGYRINKLHKDLTTHQRDHVKQAMSGVIFNADATYFIRENMGIGLKYSMHSASASSYVSDVPSYMSFWMEDDVYIHYVGPNYVFRLFNSSGKGSFIASIGLGYMAYIDNSEMSNRSPDRITLTGQTLGTNLDAGYEIYLTKQLSVGAQISYYSGVLTKMKGKSYYGISETIELDKDQYEGLNRIDISAGLRLNF